MSGPRNAEDRLRRLLVMLPYLMEEGEVPLDVVAARFDMSPAQVTRDLELVAMCGLPPYVDEMIDVFVDDGMVYVGVPRLFTRTLRLTAPEAFSLLVSARAAMELPGFDADGSLARGMDKLAAALGAVGLDTPGAGDDTAGVAIDLDRPAFADLLIDAVAESAELRVRYYSPSRDEVSERVMVPRHVFVEHGNWYVLADDARSSQRRTFRIDRVEAVERTGATVPNDDGEVAPAPFFTDVEVPRAVLRVGPRARWIVDRYPVDEVVDDGPDGWATVTMPLASERWMARLLIRLGRDAELVAPASLGRIVDDLVGRMLDRYRD